MNYLQIHPRFDPKSVGALPPGGWVHLTELFRLRRPLWTLLEALPWVYWDKVQAPPEERNAPINEIVGGRFYYHRSRSPSFVRALEDDVGCSALSTAASCWADRPLHLLQVRLLKYEAGDYIGPHDDRYYGGLTAVFHFNATWQPQWGGELEIGEQRRWQRTGLPILGSVTVFRPPVWHRTRPIAKQAGSPKICMTARWLDPTHPALVKQRLVF